MRKIKKLIKHPGIFFRDYFNKKYPVTNSELMLVEQHEQLLIENDRNLTALESALRGNTHPIDVVFTWVNSQDPVWQEKYRTAAITADRCGLHGSDPARFSDHNELYYSVYAVQKLIPWVRNIYIVTDAQKPAWLDTAQNPNIRVIDHADIIDAHYLPTFNSHVIEAHLHNIPGLSENFIYFNDDVFVARPLEAAHFFRANGIASLFISAKRLSAMHQKGILTPTLHASCNSAALLQRDYAADIDMPLVHTYIPLKKSMFQLAWQQYGEEIRAFLPNRLRADNDLNMATFLVPWLAYLNRQAVFTREVCYYFNIRSPHAPTQYAKLLKKNHSGGQPHSFCANDFNSQTHIPDYQEKLVSMLKNYYQI